MHINIPFLKIKVIKNILKNIFFQWFDIGNVTGDSYTIFTIPLHIYANQVFSVSGCDYGARSNYPNIDPTVYIIDSFNSYLEMASKRVPYTHLEAQLYGRFLVINA